MANDLNHCSFIGRLGKDVETRFMPSGEAVANFTIAVGWKSKDKEGAEWVRIVAFGKLAEICRDYLAKGKQVYVSGRFRTREYDKDGVKHYATEIVADQLQMLGSKDDQASRQERPASTRQPASAPSDSGFSDMGEDIPFAPSFARAAWSAI